MCKDNGEAIRAVCREFIVLCRQFDLFSKAIIAIDGSKLIHCNRFRLCEKTKQGTH